MAHESFESEAVAAIMNREFVNIKVDREERPDVDRVYMTFVQATTGHGGWPMSVWLTPDLEPFAGGTYFPPEDRYGQPGFARVLERIAEAWKQNREKIAEQGARIVEALRQSQEASAASAEKVGTGVLEKAFEQFSGTFDPEEGGFGNAPKFPRPVALNFLLRFYASKVAHAARLPSTPSATGTVAPQSERALEIVLLTLRKMAAGGMRDHLGGGFHRYSVDRFWHVPHFEKMLYDQAQLAVAYLDAYQITSGSDVAQPSRLRTQGKSKPEACSTFAAVVRDILDYVARDMTSKEGGFFSAEDADSPVAAVCDRRTNLSEAQPADKSSGAHPPAHGSGAHRAPLQKTAEGAFYVWTKEEIDTALGSGAECFNFHYGVEPEGNAPAGSDPQGEFHDKNILIQRHTIAETAKQFGKERRRNWQFAGPEPTKIVGDPIAAAATAFGR